MATDKKLITLKTLNKSNVWELQENDVFRIWSAGEKDADMTENINRYITILRSAFEIEEVKVDRPEIIRKYEMRGMCVGLLRVDESNKVKYAIKKRPILRVTDLTYENIRHISAAKLLEVIERNFGGGWDSIPLSLKDVIESAFEISTTTLPASRIHAAGGTLEKKVADGFEVLEVAKGTWVEAIFAKKKAPATKLRFFAENEYDEDGNRIRRHGEDDDEEDDDLIDERDEDEEEEEDEDIQPNEDDDTFYSSFAPEADVKVDDDDDTAGLSVLE